MASVLPRAQADGLDERDGTADAGIATPWGDRDRCRAWDLDPEEFTVVVYDILIHAQGKKLVWSGDNPVSSSDFDQYYYHSSNTDKLKGNFINTKEEIDALMDNHNLITTVKTENLKALENMKRLIEGAR